MHEHDGLSPTHEMYLKVIYRLRQENEIARFQRHRRRAIDRQLATPLDHRAEPRMAEITIARRPRPRTADPFGKDSARAKQRDEI